MKQYSQIYAKPLAGSAQCVASMACENEPETLHRARWMLMAKDYIRFKLTGEICGGTIGYVSAEFAGQSDGKMGPKLFRIWGIEKAFEKMRGSSSQQRLLDRCLQKQLEHAA